MHAPHVSARTVWKCIGLAAFAWPLAAWSGPVIVEEAHKIVSPDPAFTLGGEVAIHENWLLTRGTRPAEGRVISAVFMFERQGGSGAWSYVSKLVEIEHNPVDRHVLDVGLAIDSEIAVIAALDVAYVFERDASGWSQPAMLSRPAGAVDFGSDAVLITGGIVIGGLATAPTGVVALAGFVYIKNASGEWTFVEQLLAGPTVSDNDFAGPRLDGHGNTVIIGSSPNSIDEPEPGGAYLYQEQNGVWTLAARMTDFPPGGGASHVAVFGFHAALNSVRWGGLNIYSEEDPNDWWPREPVAPPERLMQRRLPSGSFLDMGQPPGSNVVIAVGAPGDGHRGANSGSVSIYQHQTGGLGAPYYRVAKLLASDAAAGTALGNHVSVHRGRVAASAAGATYVFELPVRFEQPQSLQDDFEDGNTAGWTMLPSTWSVVSSGGTQVYRQDDLGGDARSLLENLDWRDQSIQVDVRALQFNGPDRWFGLIVRYTDAGNYYYVTARRSGVIELKKIVNGAYQTLASAPLDITTDRTYRLRLEAVGTRLRVHVDGDLVAEATDAAHTNGTAGLAMYRTRAEYDNVVITPNPQLTLFADDFEDVDFFRWATTPDGAWTVVEGDSRVLRQAAAGIGDARADTGAYTEIEGTFDSGDQIVQADARPVSFASGGWFGLMARRAGAESYYYVTVRDSNTISLRRLDNGRINILGTAPMTVTPGTWYRVRLEAIGASLRVYVNSTLLLEATESPGHVYEWGTSGLVTYKAVADFDNVRVVQP